MLVKGVIFLCLLTIVYGECAAKAPVWSETHTVKAILFIPYSEIEEPLYGWYDGPSQQSRIDYYGDTVKTYQLPTTFDYGTSLKIAPVTNETETNVRTCLQINGTEDYTIETQSILPDLTGFECAGEELISGVLAEKWTLSESIEQKVNKYTMWLHYKEDLNTPPARIAIPLRYEMKGYNSLLGSHYDHYYVEYDYFDSEPISPETFKLDPDMTCSAFPGPGIQHVYTFNPVAEFIHPAKSSHVDHEFDKFAKEHSKQYKTVTDHAVRKEIFRQNVRFIHSVNRQSKGFTLGINHLADKNPAELKALRGRTSSGGYNGGAAFPHKNIAKEDLPEQWDWRLYGAVTPVKDQSVCGSCWSFAAAETVEGTLFLHNGGQLIRLSEQSLMDCSWGFGNNACEGGEDFRAYQWMLKHGGIPTDESYGPYLGEDGYCHADEVPKVAKISGYVNVTTNDEDALRLAIFKQGPISVSIDASQLTFSFYSNGVYYDPNCGNTDADLDHAVLAVGYGTINGENYWLIKNSWSNYWGNDGYILMSSKQNNCGVMTVPTYVTLADDPQNV